MWNPVCRCAMTQARGRGATLLVRYGGRLSRCARNVMSREEQFALQTDSSCSRRAAATIASAQGMRGFAPCIRPEVRVAVREGQRAACTTSTAATSPRA